MAHISSFMFWRHLSSTPTSHVRFFKRGRLKKSGRGLTLWFLPLGASVVEVPVDDREVPFLFHARSADYQDVTVQGVVTYRVDDAARLSQRVDFSVDLERGVHTEQPLDKLALIVTQLVQQLALGAIASTPLPELLERGMAMLRAEIQAGLDAEQGLHDLGIAIVSTRIGSIKPTSDVDKALQMPTREAIQQRADEATFARRALAVEKERAIQENELHNRIELARREEQLIDQQGKNDRQRATEKSIAERIMAESAAERITVQAAADAERIRVVEGAEVAAERDRMAIYSDLPVETLMALAARGLAENMPNIDNLQISPDLLGPLVTRLVRAGTTRLEADDAR